MTRIMYLLGALALLVGGGATAAFAGDEHPDKVFVCKYVGTPGVDETLQTGQNPISVSINSISGFPGVGGSFADAQGRSLVIAFDTGQDEPSCPDGQGCEEACPPPPVDVCTNIDGLQESVPEGFHASEDENGRPICVQDEQPPDVCPNLDGNQQQVPDGYQLVNGECVVIPPPDVCPNIDGTQSQVPAGMVVDTNGNCVTPVPPSPTGDAQVICLLPAGIYQLSGHVDGQTADTVSPATLPGSTRGVTNVVVTRGDTSVRTAVATNGDCGTTTTVTVITTATPPAVVTPPVVAKPPAVKPKPPARKPAAKPKTKPKVVAKPKPKHKANKKPHKAPQTLSL